MAKPWASRFIVGVQTGCWFVAILLLLYRGVTNLRNSAAAIRRSQIHRRPVVISPVAGNTSEEDDGQYNGTGSPTWPGLAIRKPPEPGRHQLFMGLVLIAVAALMVLATCAILLARRYERRRYKSVEQIEQQPPCYEDVVDQMEEEEHAPAPRYSSLDLAASPSI